MKQEYREYRGIQCPLLAEGKTKKIWAIPNTHTVLVESKDDITASDGLRRDVMEGKAAIANATTCNVFEFLTAQDIRNHFIEQVDETTFHALKVDMVPVESVVRGIATGSYLKRKPDVAEGTILDPPVTELFFKDDARHDPLMQWEMIAEDEEGWVLYDAKLPVSVENFLGILSVDKLMINGLLFTSLTSDSMRKTTLQVYQKLADAWRKLGVLCVDLKLEFGVDRTTGQLILADVIDNDSWRIWPGGQKGNQLDKQKYRELLEVTADDLGAIKSDYALVAQLTKQFLNS